MHPQRRAVGFGPGRIRVAFGAERRGIEFGENPHNDDEIPPTQCHDNPTGGYD